MPQTKKFRTAMCMAPADIITDSEKNITEPVSQSTGSFLSRQYNLARILFFSISSPEQKTVKI